MAQEFGTIIENQLTSSNISLWLEGVTCSDYGDEFEGMSGPELRPFILNISIPTDGVTTEIAPNTKKLHAHLLIEVKHVACLQVNHAAITYAFTRALRDHLKPRNGGKIYVNVRAVPASTNYVLDYIRKQNGEEFNMNNLVEEIYS